MRSPTALTGGGDLPGRAALRPLSETAAHGASLGLDPLHPARVLAR